MNQMRFIVFFVAVVAAVLGGVFLLSRINQDASIVPSSANVYNIIGLSKVDDNVLYPENLVIDVNTQILTEQSIRDGRIMIEFDKNVLQVEDIIMDSNITALNQKVDRNNGTITLDIQSTLPQGIEGVQNIASLIFSRISLGSNSTTINLSSDSSLGNPNTLDLAGKSLLVQF